MYDLCLQGASWSVIYVDIDAHNRNRVTVSTLLPRESSSKVMYKQLGFLESMECSWCVSL